jgi:hypothetical protein
LKYFNLSKTELSKLSPRYNGFELWYSKNRAKRIEVWTSFSKNYGFMKRHVLMKTVVSLGQH